MVTDRRRPRADYEAMSRRNNRRNRRPGNPLVPYPGRHTPEFQVWIRLSALHRIWSRGE